MRSLIARLVLIALRDPRVQGELRELRKLQNPPAVAPTFNVVVPDTRSFERWLGTRESRQMITDVLNDAMRRAGMVSRIPPPPPAAARPPTGAPPAVADRPQMLLRWTPMSKRIYRKLLAWLHSPDFR